MDELNEEDKLLQSVALQNAKSTFQARQRAEEDLAEAHEALKLRTAELASSLAMVRATFEHAAVGMAIADLDGRFLRVNGKCVEILGYPAEELCAKTFFDVSHPEDLESLRASIARLSDEAAEFSFEQRYVRGDAGAVWGRTTVALLKNTADQPQQFVAVIEDISQRRRAEAAARESAELRALLAAVVESSDDAIVSKNLNGIISSWNRGAERMFGYTADEVIGKPVVILLPPERLNEEAGILAKLRAGERIDHFETVRVRKDGTKLDVSLTVSPVKDAEGRVIGASKIARDITGRKRAEEGLRRSEEQLRALAEERKQLLDAERNARSEVERVSIMKDEFLANLSHELRTPLNAIVGWSQILRMQGSADAQILEGLSVIDRNVKVQTQLIEDLLDMSRIISGKLRLDVQRVDVHDLVKAAVASFRHSADAKGIRLEIELDSASALVRGDPGRLQQCFWNLLSNAIKFTPKGGHVRVGLARAQSQLELRVADTGQGIEPEFLPFVFERFRQADASMTRHHGGLGLGLSIVKCLVELHGGSVRASSPGTGRGATFSILLPITVVDMPVNGRRGATNASAAGSAALDQPSLKGLSVLAIDDEPDARYLVQRVLEDSGARVFAAASAKAALEILRRERPNVIVSDIGMPDEDGYEFIRKVRMLAPDEGGQTPAVALSAFARTEDRTRSLQAGYQAHLVKPTAPNELTAAVASLATK